MSSWYHLARFRCPGCGQRLVVESRQVTRHDHVACQHCNTDLVLTPRGEDHAVEPDPNTGLRPTVVMVAI